MIPGLSDANVSDKRTISKTYEIGGKKLTLETARLALLANGSVVIRDEAGNYLLTAVGLKDEANLAASFFPLTVEFQEKYYAAGKIGGNRFMKREGRPSENAVLNSRMIDRPIRPMFPKGCLNEVQIISTILSSSGVSDYGFHGITGASLALQLAGVVEFEGPVSGARIALTESGFVFDPDFATLEKASLDLTVAGTPDAITMVESQGLEIDDATMLSAFEFAHGLIRELCAAQTDFIAEYRKTHAIPEFRFTVRKFDATLESFVTDAVTDEFVTPLFGTGKAEFHDRLHELEDRVIEHFGKFGKEASLLSSALSSAEPSAIEAEIREHVYGAVKKKMRSKVLATQVRLDGRKPDEVRNVRATCGFLPRVHGSVLFERGITQALSITTLGGPGDIQIIDDMFEEDTKRYIHHYNFPPYSVGEVKPLRGVGRREIGHGRLAEKALEPVLPALESFPYFIRVVSEITTCNGSSSMASVCGSSLSLMDAGVPIRAMVAGVAMGMVYDEDTGKYEVLSDIQAQEDFLGDLDFKVAGTEKGITALQMDCKIAGLNLDVVKRVLSQSKGALDYIRGEMKKELSAPRGTLSQYAPSILSLTIPVERIREIIGKGGEMIQKICRDFSVEVDVKDDGFVSITAKNQENGENALAFIKELLREIEPGEIHEGKIVKILDGVGAIVELGKQSGMIHISKIAKERVERIEAYVNVGDIVKVKVLTVDREKGRIGLERIVP
jgi:polyribonucleotide nucleotidyltransferase